MKRASECGCGFILVVKSSWAVVITSFYYEFLNIFLCLHSAGFTISCNQLSCIRVHEDFSQSRVHVILFNQYQGPEVLVEVDWLGMNTFVFVFVFFHVLFCWFLEKNQKKEKKRHAFSKELFTMFSVGFSVRWDKKFILTRKACTSGQKISPFVFFFSFPP